MERDDHAFLLGDPVASEFMIFSRSQQRLFRAGQCGTTAQTA
jgi:hypothetical protein